MKTYKVELTEDFIRESENAACPEWKIKANLIWDKLFSIKNENKTKDEQLQMIESVIIEIVQEQRKIGRTQILNYMQDEVNKLRD